MNIIYMKKKTKQNTAKICMCNSFVCVCCVWRAYNNYNIVEFQFGSHTHKVNQQPRHILSSTLRAATSNVTKFDNGARSLKYNFPMIYISFSIYTCCWCNIGLYSCTKSYSSPRI